jgi:carbonic anhydrase/acetyltransferase-like protein (isoleucine patch superfamily)
LLVEFEGKKPRVHRTAFLHPTATLIGDVRLGDHSSVWPGAIIRGDFESVEIGRYTCIQDNAVVHSADTYAEKAVRYLPVKVGDYVVVGHGALLHGCTVADNCIVGAGSIVFNGAKVGEGSLIGMGAVVLANVEVPPRTVVVGIPARPLRRMTDEEVKRIRVQAKNYAKLAQRHKKQLILV